MRACIPPRFRRAQLWFFSTVPPRNTGSPYDVAFLLPYSFFFSVSPASPTQKRILPPRPPLSRPDRNQLSPFFPPPLQTLREPFGPQSSSKLKCPRDPPSPAFCSPLGPSTTLLLYIPFDVFSPPSNQHGFHWEVQTFRSQQPCLSFPPRLRPPSGPQEKYTYFCAGSRTFHDGLPSLI